MLTFIAANWQKDLPALAVVGAAVWVALPQRSGERTGDLRHQIEEHLWPGGFRQYTNAHVFESGRDDWPVDPNGVALVNIGYVWLPTAAAAVFRQALRWLGLTWIWVTLINAVTHIVTSIRFRSYNPGLVTAVVLFVPFTCWALVHEAARGLLSGTDIGLIVLLGLLLHIPVAALFVIPYLRKRATAV